MILTCDFCGGQATVQDSARVYRGRSYGNIFLCENYPVCDAFVGVHKSTGEPLGTLANQELRNLRKQCHLVFDAVWKSGKMSRPAAYIWASELMCLPEDAMHIAMFEKSQCETFLRILTSAVPATLKGEAKYDGQL